MNRLLKLLAALLALAPLSAQSPLNLYGLGALQSAEDVASDGAGNIRSLPLTEGDAYPASVASWHHLRSTQIRTTLATQMSMTPADGDPRYKTGLRRIIFMVHLDNRSALGFALSPLTQTDLSLNDTTGSFILGTDTLLYHQIRSISGGLSSLQVGYSRKLGRSISVGVALDILFGALYQNDTLQFSSIGSRVDILGWIPPGAQYLGAERTVNFLGRSLELNLTTGAFPVSRSQLGIRVNLPLSLRTKVITRFINAAPFTEVNTIKMQLPVSLNIGYAIKLGQRQRLLAEWNLQQWQDFDGNDLIFGRQFEKVQGWAASWTSKPAALASASPGRMFYRVGFHNKSYYLSDRENESLGEVAFSVGFGIRSLRTNHKLDFALQIGQRDALDDLDSENFGRLSIGVTMGEMWFARPKKNWN